MDWIDSAQVKDRWWAAVNAVMNLRVTEFSGRIWLGEELLACQEVLCSMELVS